MKKALPFTLIAIAAIIAAAVFFSGRNNESAEENAPQPSQHNTAEVAGEERTSIFRGTVLDGITKQPLAAKIIVKDNGQIVKNAECSDSGEFTLSLSDGEYQITAEYPGYVAKGTFDVSHPIEIDGAPESSETITLWPESQIKGRVVSDDKGVPAEIKFIYQKDASNAKDYIFKTINAEKSGEFLLKGAYGGVMDIELAADGLVTQNLADIELEPGKTIDLGDIPMKYGVVVYGTVTDAVTNEPIPGATLKYIDKNGKMLSQTNSQTDGSYQLPAIDLQNVRFVAGANGYANLSETITPDDQLRYEYNVALLKRTGIGISINNQTGRTPLKTLVTITDITSEKVVYEHEYEQNGYYYLDSLKDGPYLIHATSYDKISESTKRAVGGSTVMLILKPFAKLNVQFVMKDNQAPSGSYRYIYKPDSGDEMSTEWTGFANDTVMINDLMPGSYQIEARTDNSRVPRSREIRLEMGETRFISVKLDDEKQNSDTEIDKTQTELAAKEKFQSINEEYQDFMLTSLEGIDISELDTQLNVINQKLAGTIKQYTEVIGGGSPEWRIASMTNMASMFEHTYNELKSVDIPQDLPDDVRQQIKAVLDGFANQFKMQGNKLYNDAVKMSDNSGIKTEYTERAQKALEALGQ